MREAIESLSISSGAVVVAAVSAILATLFLRVRQRAIAWFAAVLPVLIACSLYWSPVWLGANPAEYFSWSLLFCAVWSFSGIVAFSSALMIGYHLQNRHER